MKRQRLDWLGLTAEPERDLPLALATLRAAGKPAEAAVLAERQTVEDLVLHGSHRRWLRYLREAAGSVPAAPPADPGLRAAAIVAAEVVLNHHRLLAGIPGSGYETAADDRRRMRTFLTDARGGTT